MKVLLVYMDGFQKCFKHIVTYLRDRDIEVHELAIEVGQPNGRYVLLNQDLIDSHRDIDYILWCEHSDSIEARHFETEIGCKSICIEHDLLTLYPQTSANNVLTFSFTKPHYDWCLKNNINTVKAKFYKEALQPTIEKEKGLNAAIIGSEYADFQHLLNKEGFKYQHLFDKVYYKPYGEGETPVKGTEVHPETLGAHGTRNLAQLAKYWFVVNSSSYIDALLFGCIPIVMGYPDNPYFSHDKFYSELDCYYIPDYLTKSVIDDNRDINGVPINEYLCKKAWLFEEDLPTVEEVLYEQLRNG